MLGAEAGLWCKFCPKLAPETRFGAQYACSPVARRRKQACWAPKRASRASFGQNLHQRPASAPSTLASLSQGE